MIDSVPVTISCVRCKEMSMFARPISMYADDELIQAESGTVEFAVTTGNDLIHAHHVVDAHRPIHGVVNIKCDPPLDKLGPF